MRKAYDSAKRLGGHVRYLDENDMRQRGMPKTFLFGIHEEAGGILNPGLYVSALRAEAIKSGVRLFEDTPVTRVKSGKTVTLKTPRGSVRAPKAVLTTNAYTRSTGVMKGAVTPLRITLFETAPLTEDQMKAVGWIRREGIYTAHEILENYRFAARNTILGGSKTFRSGFGGSRPGSRHPPTFDLLETAFRERFPMLEDLTIEKFWGGWIGVTPDFLPRLGPRGKHKNIYYGIGFNGHGIPQATMVGEILAHKIEDKAHKWEHALDPRAFPWPPEPFLSLGSKTLSWLLHSADRKTDKRIRQTTAV